MGITLLSSGLPNLLPARGRSPGLHHSVVLSDLCVRMGHYEKSEMNMTRTQLGCALEDTLDLRYNQEYPGRYIRGEELLIGGELPITLDFLDSQLYKPRETKLSWMSSRHDPMSEKFQRFWWQVAGQCLALGTDRGDLAICHINGDYKGFDVHFNVWERVYSKVELMQYETMILRHRDRMLREGYQGEG